MHGIVITRYSEVKMLNIPSALAAQFKLTIEEENYYEYFA